jgi:hypothetical protein
VSAGAGCAGARWTPAITTTYVITLSVPTVATASTYTTRAHVASSRQVGNRSGCPGAQWANDRTTPLIGQNRGPGGDQEDVPQKQCICCPDIYYTRGPIPHIRSGEDQGGNDDEGLRDFISKKNGIRLLLSALERIEARSRDLWLWNDL